MRRHTMTMLWLAVWCAMVAVAVGQRRAECCEEYCYQLDSERTQSSHFSTKTAYEIARGTEAGRQYYVPSTVWFFSIRENRELRTKILFSSWTDCNPTKIWLLSRHGTRLPSVKDIQAFRKLEEVGFLKNLLPSCACQRIYIIFISVAWWSGW